MNPQPNEDKPPRIGVDPYLDWLKGEGIPVVEDFGVDLFEVPHPSLGALGDRRRRGAPERARGLRFDVCAGNAPGASTARQHHVRGSPLRGGDRSESSDKEEASEHLEGRLVLR